VGESPVPPGAGTIRVFIVDDHSIVRHGLMYVSANTIIMTAASGIGPAVFTAILTSRTIAHTPIPDPVVFKYLWLYAAACAVMAVIALLVRRPRYIPAGVPVGTLETVGNIETAPPARPPSDPTCSPAPARSRRGTHGGVRLGG
jgi:hypothetical protein